MCSNSPINFNFDQNKFELKKSILNNFSTIGWNIMKPTWVHSYSSSRALEWYKIVTRGAVVGEISTCQTNKTNIIPSFIDRSFVNATHARFHGCSGTQILYCFHQFLCCFLTLPYAFQTLTIYLRCLDQGFLLSILWAQQNERTYAKKKHQI